MKVILLKDVSGIGQRGSVKDVTDGYALNFLIPKKLAEHATTGKILEHEAWSQAVEGARKKKEGEYDVLMSRLQNTHITIKARTNATGKLYEQVTPELVAERIQQQFNVSVPEDAIRFLEPIRQVGESTVRIHLGEKRASLVVHVEGLDKVK